jgi:hypothetical protein
MRILLLFLACRVPDRVDACDLRSDDPELDMCPACTTDAECSWVGNPCTDAVYCAHKDAPLAVIAIGCSKAMEYRWPSEADCGCVEGACRSR